MKYILALFFVVFNMPVLLVGQQITLYSQYRNQLSILNPAGLSIDYLKEKSNISYGISHRQQWENLIEDAPVNSLAYLKWISTEKSISVSGHIMNDKAGAISNTGIYGSFAYRIEINRLHTINLGISAGAVQYRIKLHKIFSHNQSNNGNANSMRPDFVAGIFYTYNDKIYAGLVVPQLFPFSPKGAKKATETTRVRHYFLTIGAYRGGGIDGAFFEPSILLRTAEVPDNDGIGIIGVDFNFRYKIIDAFWLGGGWSTTSILHLEAGVVIGNNKLLNFLRLKNN